jgi:hypothetical protein
VILSEHEVALDGIFVQIGRFPQQRWPALPERQLRALRAEATTVTAAAGCSWSS